MPQKTSPDSFSSATNSSSSSSPATASQIAEVKSSPSNESSGPGGIFLPIRTKSAPVPDPLGSSGSSEGSDDDGGGSHAVAAVSASDKSYTDGSGGGAFGSLSLTSSSSTGADSGPVVDSPHQLHGSRGTSSSSEKVKLLEDMSKPLVPALSNTQLYDLDQPEVFIDTRLERSTARRVSSERRAVIMDDDELYELNQPGVTGSRQAVQLSDSSENADDQSERQQRQQQEKNSEGPVELVILPTRQESRFTRFMRRVRDMVPHCAFLCESRRR